MLFILFALGSGVCFYFVIKIRRKEKALQEDSAPTKSDTKGLLPKDKDTLTQHVLFYNGLDEEEKLVFEERIIHFLSECKVTGVNVAVVDADSILIAASAIIPIFRFPDWTYDNIDEILLYPNAFNQDFDQVGNHRSILGMVGNGYMEGKMILSKEALYQGFKNSSDKNNTAIHEFVHLIDKSDGNIDGVPELLLDKQFILPWMDFIEAKIEEIQEGKTGINKYGATNAAEFLAVTSEYFFERPKLLHKKHPDLYEMLEEIFNSSMKDHALKSVNRDLGRNDPCYCGSGKKFKHCHGNEA